MQRRTQGSDYRSPQSTRRSASYSDRGYSRTASQGRSVSQYRRTKKTSVLKMILFGKNCAGQTPVWRLLFAVLTGEAFFLAFVIQNTKAIQQIQP